MNLGYARVSTQEQNLDMQLDALEGFGCDKIFQEKVSGVSKEKPELQELLKMAREGDTVVVWKLDRLGRTTRQLVELVDDLGKSNINFVSINENIDTTSKVGKLIFTIFSALAEMEREILIERTKAGLEAARARGRVGGRPRKNQKKVELALQMYESGDYYIKQIEEATGVSKATIYRYLKKQKSS